jgi:hypothetical protein
MLDSDLVLLNTQAARRIRRRLACGVAALTLALAVSGGAAASSKAAAPAVPDFGPNVKIFDPSMSTSDIQSAVNAIYAQQKSNEFGTNRYALLFEPGSYGSPANPLKIPVGYYTDVAGLGNSPDDVTINGAVDSFDQCDATNFCTALTNFWRSVSNLSIDVKGSGCEGAAEFWAASQAAPVRRVHVNGLTTLFDFCDGPSFASGGFISDSLFTGSTVINGTQQQYLVRNSNLDGWTNGVWNQVFAGVQGAPAQAFPSPPYTTLASAPESREKPFLYLDSHDDFNIYVPSVQFDSSGPTWSGGQTPGRSIPIEDFFIAHPGDSVQSINNALSRGKNLLFTPGAYEIDQTIKVKHADTIVLGLGMPTLEAENGVVPMTVADQPGIEVSELMFDAGPVNSPVLLRVGTGQGDSGVGRSDASDPTTLSDVFFRIGGPHIGKATVSLEVNSDHVVLDDIWAWRADHGSGVGWTTNTADTGVVVNGDDVTATGLFVEHFQKYEVVWNGEDGKTIMFQNEMPYDPPSQAAWMEASGVDGWAAFKVGDGVKSFSGYGMGSYSFFNQGLNIYAAHAFEVPQTLPPGSLHDLLTVFLDPVHGSGGILNVVNDSGGPSTIANPDVPVTVVSYP